MKAIQFTQYGPPEVLKTVEIEKPVPKDDEVLVKNYAATVNFGDLITRNFKEVTPASFNMPFLFWIISTLVFGIRKPRIQILGSEFAGEVESVGTDVRKFKTGDHVFGYAGMRMGAYAEFLSVSENSIMTEKPENMSFRQAAALPYGAITALSLLRKGGIENKKTVLIIGASGGIGSFAVQFAKFYGAEVTGVCSTPRVEYVKDLGADSVVDYTKEDFTDIEQKYDLIFDVLNKSTFLKCKDLLTENGTYLLANFKMKELLQMMTTSWSSGKKVICALSSEKVSDLEYIAELVKQGHLKSLIDRSFPMEKASEAHSYAESGRKKGAVVIDIP